MNPDDFLLACLYPLDGAPIGIMQLQKLPFLLIRGCPPGSFGEKPPFEFEIGDYGPRDPHIQDIAVCLEMIGCMFFLHAPGTTPNRYALSVKGQRRAQPHFLSMTEPQRKLATSLARWILPLSFTEIVAAVRKAYPDEFRK